jgi:GAF domain-containing protein
MNFETRLFNCADLQSILDCVLDGGLELTDANLGNVKLVDQRQGYLTIAAQRGFHQEFLDFFHRANADDSLSICGRALRERRAIISDVMSDEEFAPWRSVAERAGFRSLQSTPIISSSGALFGILSTHFPSPHQPTEREMNAVRSLAKLAANAIVRVRIVTRLRIRMPCPSARTGNQYRVLHSIETLNWPSSMTMVYGRSFIRAGVYLADG